MKPDYPLAMLLVLLLFPIPSSSQQKKTPLPSHPPLLVRTTMRHESLRFAYGGTLSLDGAPEGSVTIEGWAQNEIDVSAEIQLHADTEADLNLLAAVNTFVIDEDANHVRIMTSGTHDKAFMRTVAKKFPKALLGLPWKIDYRVRVPMATDLEINAGRGTVAVKGVEGNIRLSATESVANLSAAGGTLSATIAIGKVNLSIPTRSWRGNGAEVRIAAGELTVELPSGFNGEINADILRSGRIEDGYGVDARRTRGIAAPNQLRARAGAGGAFFQFTVGDGAIYIKKLAADKQ